MEMATSLSYKSTSMLVWCVYNCVQTTNKPCLYQPTNTSHLAGTTKAPHRCDAEVTVLIQ